MTNMKGKATDKQNIDRTKSARLGEWRLNDFRLEPTKYVYVRIKGIKK